MGLAQTLSILWGGWQLPGLTQTTASLCPSCPPEALPGGPWVLRPGQASSLPVGLRL